MRGWAQAPIGTAFTFQGQLKQTGQPLNEPADFEFRLWDAAADGSEVAPVVTLLDVPIHNGLFVVPLDFGEGLFRNEARWLEVAVRFPAGTGSFVPLTPRHPLTPAPCALALPGLSTMQSTVSPNIIGGWEENTITAGVVGATLAGGGSPDISGSPRPNRVTDDYGTVSGGSGNTAGDNDATPDDARHATVGGGYANSAGAPVSTVGGGWYNRATGERATVAGGWNNLASAHAATVGGGRDNQATGSRSTVPGGGGNYAAGDRSFAAGWRAKANHAGAFVWADTTDQDFASTGNDQFLIRASGGVGVGTTDPQAELDVAGIIRMSGIKLTQAAQSGYVLTCNDATGVATWQPPSGGGGFTLPYHGPAATDIPAFWVTNSGAGPAGLFETENPQSITGYAELGVWEDAGEFIYNGYGIRAFGSTDGGYFENGSGTSYAHIAHRNYSPMIGSWGIRAAGTSGGGHFQDSDSSGWAALGNGDYGVKAFGASYGGYFSSDSATGVGVYGIATSNPGVNIGVYGATNSTEGYAGYFDGLAYFSNFVGIGTLTPTAQLEVVGGITTGGIRITGSNPTEGHVLTSDSQGYGSWEPNTLSLPYEGTVGSVGPAFMITNTGPGSAAYFDGDTSVVGALNVSGNIATDAFQLVTGAADGRVLTSDAGGVASWQPPELDYPYDRTVALTDPAFNITNTDVGPALRGQGKWGHYGYLGDYQYGVYGIDSSGEAYGYLGGSSTGAYGQYTSADGEVSGKLGSYKRGVFGSADFEDDFGKGIGVAGHAARGGTGVYARSTGSDGIGVHAEALGTNGIGIKAEGGPGGYAADFIGRVRITAGSSGKRTMELGDGLDYAEGFNVTEPATIGPGSVLIIDPENPGKLALSRTPYDPKVAGIVAGANGLGSGVRLGAGEFDHDVALAGRVYCNVDATDSGIEPGDLLTTSATPGHAMKATESERANGAILGKAMERIEKGKTGRILVLVSLQ
jgi:hypothetical protein